MQLSWEPLLKSLTRGQRKVNRYDFFGCVNKEVIAFKNCECVFNLVIPLQGSAASLRKVHIACMFSEDV